MKFEDLEDFKSEGERPLNLPESAEVYKLVLTMTLIELRLKHESIEGRIIPIDHEEKPFLTWVVKMPNDVNTLYKTGKS